MFLSLALLINFYNKIVDKLIEKNNIQLINPMKIFDVRYNSFSFYIIVTLLELFLLILILKNEIV
ncbi:hypothetical protein Q361_11195 [Flavobacterium croceum DSM 17960]|uniref:Uncharacterized protein n=1 Tax=Flavobacterium croceum DSM 17960 TaxID=1121886 RepID=A0A2S4N6R3_9FLAO|nr:hypothetical protein Q361_11195 [Flavobacterium croceum DSM 17960]